jgi:hypothetical protein
MGLGELSLQQSVLPWVRLTVKSPWLRNAACFSGGAVKIMNNHGKLNP